MKLRILLPIISLAMALAARAQAPTQAGYSFTLLPGDTISNIFVLNDDPEQAYSFFISVTGNSGSITLLDTGTGAQYLSIIATFTDAQSNSGLAFSLPSSVASTVISNNDTWAEFASAYSLSEYGSQATIENELETHGLQSQDGEEMFPSADDIPANSQALGAPVYNSYSSGYVAGVQTQGEIVGFDGAEQIGSFTYISSVPEPGAWTLLAFGMLPLLVLPLRRKRLR